MNTSDTYIDDQKIHTTDAEDKDRMVRRYEARGKLLCDEAKRRLDNGRGETSSRFPQLYGDMCEWECHIRRKLIDESELWRTIDRTLLEEVGSYKKSLKDMGTRFMRVPGGVEEWNSVAGNWNPCARRFGECDCHLARDAADDIAELDGLNSIDMSLFLSSPKVICKSDTSNPTQHSYMNVDGSIETPFFEQSLSGIYGGDQPRLGYDSDGNSTTPFHIDSNERGTPYPGATQEDRPFQ